MSKAFDRAWNFAKEEIRPKHCMICHTDELTVGTKGRQQIGGVVIDGVRYGANEICSKCLKEAIEGKFRSRFGGNE